jgi:hypothetical protein
MTEKLTRDKSGAVLNNDSTALEKYKTAKKSLRNKDSRIFKLEEKVSQLESLINDIISQRLPQ